MSSDFTIDLLGGEERPREESRANNSPGNKGQHKKNKSIIEESLAPELEKTQPPAINTPPRAKEKQAESAPVDAHLATGSPSKLAAAFSPIQPENSKQKPINEDISRPKVSEFTLPKSASIDQVPGPSQQIGDARKKETEGAFSQPRYDSRPQTAAGAFGGQQIPIEIDDFVPLQGDTTPDPLDIEPDSLISFMRFY